MPFDAGGFFTRLYDFEQDRDDGIRILASRMDAELDNIAEALNQGTRATSIIYNGEQLSTVLDRITDQLATRVIAEQVAYGTTNVSAALTDLIARMGVIEQKVKALENPDPEDILIDKYTEGYWSPGNDLIVENTWAVNAPVISEGVWSA